MPSCSSGNNKVKITGNTANAKKELYPMATLKKSETESTIPLSPVPPELKSDVPLKMEFVRRFCKPLKEMTRSDLEQLVLQKITEAMVYKSDNAALRAIIKKQDIRLHGFERSLADMTGHYEALKLVADHAVEDMKKRANSIVIPKKVVRSVGLQVSFIPAEEKPFIHQSPNVRDLVLKNVHESKEGIILPQPAKHTPYPPIGPKTFALPSTKASVSDSQFAKNQLVQNKQKDYGVDSNGAVCTVESNSPAENVYQQNGRISLNGKREKASPLQPIKRHLFTNNMEYLPDLSTEQAKQKKSRKRRNSILKYSNKN